MKSKFLLSTKALLKQSNHSLIRSQSVNFPAEVNAITIKNSGHGGKEILRALTQAILVGEGLVSQAAAHGEEQMMAGVYNVWAIQYEN